MHVQTNATIDQAREALRSLGPVARNVTEQDGHARVQVANATTSGAVQTALTDAGYQVYVTVTATDPTPTPEGVPPVLGRSSNVDGEPACTRGTGPHTDYRAEFTIDGVLQDPRPIRVIDGYTTTDDAPRILASATGVTADRIKVTNLTRI